MRSNVSPPVKGQTERKDRTLGPGSRHPQRPPMESGQFFCNGEAQAKVLLGGAGDIGPVKAVKNLGERLGGDARPGVGDL